MGNDNDKNTNVNHLVYLLCPYCFLKIPQMEVYLYNSVPKIKLTCNCTQSHNNNPILTLREYIDKMRYRDALLIQCSIHPMIRPSVFCLNCEKWLCDKCIKKEHTKEKCAQEYNNVNHYLGKCQKHSINELTLYCKKCKELLCKSCQIEHKVSTGANHIHKIIDYPKYLTDEKLDKKLKKFNEFKEQVSPRLEEIKNDIDNRIQNNNNNSLITQDDISKLNDAYTQNKENNDVLIEYIEIMLNNIDSIPIAEKDMKITNKKVILNMINNTSINSIPTNVQSIFDGKNNLKEDILTFTKFLYSTYLNLKIKFKFTNILKYSSKEQISIGCMLDESQVAISGGSSINILNTKKDRIVSVFSDHTNTVTSLFTVNGGNLVSASNDRSVKYWDTANLLKISNQLKATKEESKKKELNAQMKQYIKTVTLSTIPGMIIPILKSPNEVAIIGIEKNIEVWNFDSNKCVRKKKLEGDYYFETIGQLKNGDILLGTENSIIILNQTNLDIIKEVKNIDDNPKRFLEMNNGNIVIGYRNIGIVIYNKNFQKIQTLVGHKNVVTGLVEMENDLLISSSSDATLRIWDTKDFTCLEVVFMGREEITEMIKVENDKIVVIRGEKNVFVLKIEDVR